MSALVLGLFLLAVGAQSNSPAHTSSAIAIVEPNYGYTQPITSLRQVDFKNFDFVIFDLDGQPARNVSLENGEYHERHEETGSDLTLGSVQYFGTSPLSVKNEPGYALVTLRERDLGTSPTDASIVQVWKIEKHHIYVAQQFTFDQQAPGAGVLFDAKTPASSSGRARTTTAPLAVRAVSRWFPFIGIPANSSKKLRKRSPCPRQKNNSGVCSLTFASRSSPPDTSFSAARPLRIRTIIAAFATSGTKLQLRHGQESSSVHRFAPLCVRCLVFTGNQTLLLPRKRA